MELIPIRIFQFKLSTSYRNYLLLYMPLKDEKRINSKDVYINLILQYRTRLTNCQPLKCFW